MRFSTTSWLRHSAGAWLLLFGMLPLVAQAAVLKPRVERVSFAERSDGAGYVIRIHMTAPASAYTEPTIIGSEVRLTVFNASLKRGYHQDDPQGFITTYRVRPEKGHLNFRFEIEKGVAVRAEAYLDRNSSDLLIAVAPAAARVTVASRSVEPAAIPVQQTSDAPASHASVGRERWTLDTIVIDAGHGGHDTGAIGAGGLREKDVTLAVAQKLGAYIEEKLGLNVVYTRDDDRFIPLKDRGRFGNQAGAKLFISIHANAARSRSAQGTETYFLGMHKSASAQKVMERENSVVRLEDNADSYKDLDEQALILQTLASSSYMRKSETLAALVEEQFDERVGRTSRGVKQAGFYVLWGASMPAILVELGFITNPKEAAFLKSEDGQTYMASAIFRAVRAFKEQYERDLGIAAD